MSSDQRKSIPSNSDKYLNDAFSGYAEAYYQRELQDLRMPATIQALVQELPPWGMVEDWGCGPGHWSAELQKHNLAIQFRLIEVSEGMLEKAKTVVKEAVFEMADIRLRIVQPFSLSGIILGYVIPYLTEAEMFQVLRHATQSLQLGGCLVLAYMSSVPYRSFESTSSDGKYKLQMNYHNCETVSAFLMNHGLFRTYHHALTKIDHVDRMEVWKKINP